MTRPPAGGVPQRRGSARAAARRGALRAVAGLALAASGGLMGLGGCASAGATGGDTTRGAPAAAVPEYDAIATSWNARTEPLARLRAELVVRASIPRADGSVRDEGQLEGRLLLIAPMRLALILRKVSQTVFWLGSNQDSYWWIDLTQTEPTATLGRHALFTPRAAERLGLPIPPADVMRLLGVVPLPVWAGGPAGAVERSPIDGRAAVTVPIVQRGSAAAADTSGAGGAGGAGDGGGPTLAGYQRVWLEEGTWHPEQIEVLDAAGRVVLVARHEGRTPVTLRGRAQRPPLSSRVWIVHVPSGAELIIDVASASDGAGAGGASLIQDDAFDPAALLTRLGVRWVIDVDSGPVPAHDPAERSPAAP